MDDVRRRLEETYPAGSSIPSDRALAEAWGVDRRTVARAVALLVEGGRISADGRNRVMRSEVEPLAIGLCMDNSVTDKDASQAVGTGRLLIGRGLMRRLAEATPVRNMLWCDGLNADPYDNVPAAKDLRDRRIGALAIWPTLPADEATVGRLRDLRRAMPMVLLDRRIPGFESDFVGFDDEAAGREIARHALSLGHRRFAFYGWAVPETVHRRLQGVESVLMDAGTPLDSAHTVLVRGDVEVGRRFERLLEGPEMPTAVICANDFAAIALLSWLRERGISVPGQVAVLAIGNSFESVHEPLGLTTIAFSQEEVGRQAADLLLSRLDGTLGPSLLQAGQVEERRVPGRLVVRRSCGAPSHSVVLP